MKFPFPTSVPTPPSSPAPTPPPAPAATSTTTTTASGGTSPLYGSGGGTTAQPGSLEAQLRDYITGGMNGVTSKAFVDRGKAQLGAATEGGRAQAVNQINDDAIRRGLFRSGIPAESAAAAGRAAQGSFAQGLTNLLGQAEQQNIQGRESAANQASGLLGANRTWDQYTQQRMDQQAARAAAEAGHSFTYIDPDTGQSYQMDDRWF